MKNPPLLNRFKHAAGGLAAAFRRESNFRIQLVLGVLAIAATLALNPPLIWTALVVIMIGAVLAAELLNTALEHALDAAHPEPSPLVQIAKDCSAAAVLVLSITAVVVFLLMIRALLHGA
jgi:diacylglycerol kinase (ATP)